MITINNLFYELELKSEMHHPEDDEFILYIRLFYKNKHYTIPLDDMEKVDSLKPLVAAIYESLNDEVREETQSRFNQDYLSNLYESRREY